MFERGRKGGNKEKGSKKDKFEDGNVVKRNRMKKVGKRKKYDGIGSG